MSDRVFLPATASFAFFYGLKEMVMVVLIVLVVNMVFDR